MDKIPSEHKDRVCFAGDLIDRGPASRQVVQYVIDNGYGCVQGNHEQMMVDWKGKYSDMMWLGNGGEITLDSYYENDSEEQSYLKGILNQEVFDEHKLWMSTLPTLIEYKDVLTPDGRHLVVSHSLCHNHVKNLYGNDEYRASQAEIEIKWGRSFHKVKDAGFFNVIGHTPQKENPKINNIYANIDTGAFMGYGGWKVHKKGGLGYLTALHVPTMTIYQQECIDE